MSNRYRRLLTTLVALIMAANALQAQFYLTGADPARAKWFMIRSGNYKVIYPQGVDSLAQRYMNLLEQWRPYVMAGVKADPAPIPVVLHPFTVQSNGMVTWAPKRMELYTIPSATISYAQNWEEQLAIHESRHVGQMTIFTKGVFKPLGWLLGEQITGLGVGVYASKWLLEGDAVIAETELTQSGRGRSASFMEYYRAAALNGDYRDWSKWRYGSNRRFTPNHYALGYLITSAGRAKSGLYTYSGDLMEYYVRHFYNPNVKNAAHKKLTGEKMKDLARESLVYHANFWKDDYLSRGEFTEPHQMIQKRVNYYRNYSSSVAVGSDTLITASYGYDRPATLVMVSDNPQFLSDNPAGEKILRPFSSSAGKLELAGDKIYYTETVRSPRWELAASNDLFSYDIKSGKIERLTHKKSYNSPAVNPTADSIAVVEYPYTGGSRLVILNLEGDELCSIGAPERGQLTESVWTNNGIYALSIAQNGLGLYKLKYDSPAQEISAENKTEYCRVKMHWEQVFDAGFINIRNLRADGHVLYFESDANGVNNIYSYNTITQTLEPLTNARFAAVNPQVADGRLFYSNLDTCGYYPVYTSLQRAANSATDNYEVTLEDGRLKSNYQYPVARMLARQANEYFASKGLSLPDSSSHSNEYQVERYRRGTHLFRIHSWAPVYYNVDKIMQGSYDKWYDAASLGATIYSQNTLGTAVAMLGYSYHNGLHGGHASFEYSGWWPVFKVEAHYNGNTRIKCKVIDMGDTKLVSADDTGEPLFELITRCYLPLYFNSRGWQRGLVPQLLWKYDNHKFYSYSKDDYKSRNQVNFHLRYYQMRPVATAAIFPRWGFNVSLAGVASPAGAENFGALYGLSAYAYLPGIERKQGLKISAGYQHQAVDGKFYYMDNVIGMPRGVKERYAPNLFKFSADYAVPVNFNGLDLGFIGYYKRLQIIPFFDWARLSDKKVYNDYTSFGADLLVDGFVFKIGAPVSVGVRYARTNEPGSENHFALLFSASMF